MSIIVLTLIWGLASNLLNDEDLLPSPIKVAESIRYHFSQELFFHISITLYRVFISFFCMHDMNSYDDNFDER